MNEPQVILVDSSDQITGSAGKMQAHLDGLLHRAFSILVFNPKGEMLLQKRAAGKYHSPGLWTNACCSHPSPANNIESSAVERLKFEMGLDAAVSFKYKFEYRIELENGLIEHELDYVYTAQAEAEPVINKEEVADWKYVSTEE